MSLSFKMWSRIANVFRGDRLSRDIDEELASHIEEAVEHDRDPAEARRAFGSPLRQREASHDAKVIVWLDSLRADAVFGWRQIKKRKVTSAAAILSLGLAIGACTAAFRIVDALLLRPLPVSHPERLYALFYQELGADGKFQTYDDYSYPMFRPMRAAIKDQAELLAISYGSQTDVTYGSDDEMERAFGQYVSGWMFDSLGIRPAAGRLLTENDDLESDAHPVAVLSYDYWTRRFGRDPKAIGRTFRMGNHLYTIVGVAGESFTGTEPGTLVDVFVPSMTRDGVALAGMMWLRTLVKLKPGADAGQVREKLHAAYRAYKQEWVKSFIGIPQQFLDNIVNQRVLLEPAASGVSRTQRDYSRALAALGVLVALVLLIACANMANLMTAQAAARAREMALRVSIGAGRGRLVQLVLVESGMLALLAAAVGGLFATWAGPFVVSRIKTCSNNASTCPPDNPVHLLLPADWRVLGFGLALTLGVTILFGLAPALRAARVQPTSALKGGQDPHARRRLMHALIAAQTAFCFLVLFIAGLFVSTLDRLSHHSTGFSAERLLIVDAAPRRPESPVFWQQVAEHLQSLPGVENVALAAWPLLSGAGGNELISVGGAPLSLHDMTGFLQVSPGWLDTMKIPLIAGRDFRSTDVYPKAAIVNQAFAKRYFSGENPVGKWFSDENPGARLEIVGLAGDALYSDIHKPIAPMAYVPFQSVDKKGELKPPEHNAGTFIVRTSSADPLALAAILRKEVSRARPEFRVSNIRTQQELIDAQTIRERLLAMLALFFAVVAVLLAGVGLYGVLDYSVLQRRREIGIRIAIGAQAGDIVRRVTLDVFVMVLAGAMAGLGLGMASARYIEALLYQVKATELSVLALPALTIVMAAVLAAVAPVIRAVRIDPVETLRSE
jgi:predicted permease